MIWINTYSRISQLGENNQSRPQLQPVTSFNQVPAYATAAATASNNNPLAAPAAGTGKLQEIDLGPDATRRNVLRTQQAVFGGAEEVQEQPKHSKWRRRKRRGSEDIKRDQMVEKILNEAKLDLYDTSSVSRAVATGNDVAADERMAEEFRREFMSAQQERASQYAPVKKKPDAKMTEEERLLKGPKLGGSRSARAAMHAAMLKPAEGSKK